MTGPKPKIRYLHGYRFSVTQTADKTTVSHPQETLHANGPPSEALTQQLALEVIEGPHWVPTPSLTRHPVSGAYRVQAVVNQHLHSRVYYQYTKAEALQQFKQEFAKCQK